MGDSKLVLTPRQRLALEEETRLRQTGLLPAQPSPDNSQQLLRAFLSKWGGGGRRVEGGGRNQRDILSFCRS